jgi:hypothetical protein
MCRGRSKQTRSAPSGSAQGDASAKIAKLATVSSCERGSTVESGFALCMAALRPTSMSLAAANVRRLSRFSRPDRLVSAAPGHRRSPTQTIADTEALVGRLRLAFSVGNVNPGRDSVTIDPTQPAAGSADIDMTSDAGGRAGERWLTRPRREILPGFVHACAGSREHVTMTCARK